eukprot:PhM_4_TR449/c0_g1_i1/m.84021
MASTVEADFLKSIVKYTGGLESGRFHGKGELQYFNNMKYSGDVEHGSTHGVGTWEFPDGTRYEGEVVHNEIKGTGSYRWPNGSAYAGEVDQGLRHGHGVFISPQGCRYEGMWRRGKRHGMGTLSSPDGSTYVGEWVDNKRCGWGTATFPSKAHYEGQWRDNVQCGFGRMTWLYKETRTPDLPQGDTSVVLEAARQQVTAVGTTMPTYTGPYTPAVPKFTTKIERYEGQWVGGKMHGFGCYSWIQPAMAAPGDEITNSPFHSTNMYRGEFVEGVRTGHGSLRMADGTVVTCTWRDNKKEGAGTIRLPDGREEQVHFEGDETTTRRCATPMVEDTEAETAKEKRRDKNAKKPPPKPAPGIVKAKPLVDPEATDLTQLDIHELVEVNDPAAAINIMRAARNRLQRGKTTLLALYNMYASMNQPVVVSVPYPTMHSQRDGRENEVCTAAFASTPEFVRTGDPIHTTRNPNLRTNMNPMERLLTMLATTADAARCRAQKRADEANGRSFVVVETEISGSRITTANTRSDGPSTAPGATPGPSTSGSDKAMELALPSFFSLAQDVAVPRVSTPRGDVLTLHLWQLWEMLVDAGIVTPSFGLVEADKMLAPLMKRQREVQQDTRRCSIHDGMQEIGFNTFAEFVVHVVNHVMTYTPTTLFVSEREGLTLDGKLDLAFDMFFAPLVSAGRAMTVSGLAAQWTTARIAQDAVQTVPESEKRSLKSRNGHRRGPNAPGTSPTSANSQHRPTTAGSTASSSTANMDRTIGAEMAATALFKTTSVLAVAAEASPVAEERVGKTRLVGRSQLEVRSGMGGAITAKHVAVMQKESDEAAPLFCALRLDRILAGETRRANRERGVLWEDVRTVRPGMEAYERVLDVRLNLPPRVLIRLGDISGLLESYSTMLHDFMRSYSMCGDGEVMALPDLVRMLQDVRVFPDKVKCIDAAIRQMLSLVLEIDVDWSVMPRHVYSDPFFATPTPLLDETVRPMSVASGLLEDAETQFIRERQKQRETLMNTLRGNAGKEEVALHDTLVTLRNVSFTYPQFLQCVVALGHIVFRPAGQQHYPLATVIASTHRLLELMNEADRTSVVRVVEAAAFPPLSLPPRLVVAKRRVSINEVPIKGKAAGKR